MTNMAELTARQKLELEQKQLAEFGGVEGTSEFERGKKAIESGSLKGTLPPVQTAELAVERTLGPSQVQQPITGRTIPQGEGGLANFTDVMRQVTRASLAEQRSPLDVLRDFETKTGSKIGSTATIANVLAGEQRPRLQFAQDTFNTTVGLIAQQEENNRLFQDKLIESLPKEALQVMIKNGTIGDLQELSKGRTPDSLIQAMSQIPSAGVNWEYKEIDGVPYRVDIKTRRIEPLGADEQREPSPGGSAYISQIGKITGYGSSAWKHGLDVDLNVGDAVPSPVSGVVLSAQSRGGFGNQVVIKTDDGYRVMLSHLNNWNVKPGDKVSSGQTIGAGGNTGTVMTLAGATPTAQELARGVGSHLDITVMSPQGKWISPQEVEKFVNQSFSGGQYSLAVIPSDAIVGDPLPNGGFVSKTELAEQKKAQLLNAVLNNPSNFHILGADMQEELLPDLMETGFKIPPKETEGLNTKNKISEIGNIVSIIDTISTSTSLGAVTGIPGARSFIPGTEEQYIKALIDQVKAWVAVDNRSKLKGQGTITDKEFDVLIAASTSLKAKLSKKRTQDELAKLKTALEERKKELESTNNNSLEEIESLDNNDPSGYR